MSRTISFDQNYYFWLLKETEFYVLKAHCENIYTHQIYIQSQILPLSFKGQEIFSIQQKKQQFLKYIVASLHWQYSYSVAVQNTSLKQIHLNSIHPELSIYTLKCFKHQVTEKYVQGYKTCQLYSSKKKNNQYFQPIFYLLLQLFILGCVWGFFGFCLFLNQVFT